MKSSLLTFGMVACLLLTLTEAFSNFRPSQTTKLRASTGARSFESRLFLSTSPTQTAAYETILDFNAQFKEGLLYAYTLEPQSTSTLDSNVHAHAHPSLDAMALDVHNALLAAQNVGSYSNDAHSGYINANDNINANINARLSLDGTLEQIQQYWSSQTMLGVSGHADGHAATGNTPLLDYVTTTLLSVNSEASSSNRLFNFELPSDYERVKFGFEVKTSLLDSMAGSREISAEVLKGTRTISQDVASYILEQTQVSVQNSAPFRESIKNALVDNAERMGDAATKFAPYIGEQTRQSIINSAPARDQVKTILVANTQKVQGATAQVGSFVNERLQQSIDNSIAQTAPGREQVRNAILGNGQRLQDVTGQLGSALRQQTEQSYTNSASQIKAALLANTERLQGTGQVVSNNAQQIKAAVALSGERWQETNTQVLQQINANSAALERLVSDTRTQIGEFHFPEVSTPLQSWQELASQTPTGWTLAEVVDALKLKEFGGWYAGALVGFFLLAASNENKSAEPITSLSGATVNKRTPPKAKKTAAPPTVASASAVSIDEKRRLEGMVVELTQAVAILTNELKTLKSERTQTSNALASLQTDVNNVKDEVGKSSNTMTQSAAVAAASSELHLRSKLTASDELIDNLQAKLEVMGAEVSNGLLQQEVLPATTEPPKIIAKSPHPPSIPPLAAMATLTPSVLDESSFFATVVDKKETIVVNGAADGLSEPINGATGSANEWTIDRNPVSEFVAYWTSKRPRVPVEEGQSH